MIRAFVQARMSSRRFPGKVLAPIGGQSILKRLLEQAARIIPLTRITVLTSSELSDDPLACYARSLGAVVYRGDLDNVAARFFTCLQEYPCDWFIRLCADSPVLDATVLKTIVDYQDRLDLDLVTNVHPRTFAKGHSVEMVRAERFAALDVHALSAEEQEHVTTVFYRHPQRFRILNVTSGDSRQAELSYAVDTLEDLQRLEILGRANGWWGEAKR